MLCTTGHEEELVCVTHTYDKDTKNSNDDDDTVVLYDGLTDTVDARMSCSLLTATTTLTNDGRGDGGSSNSSDTGDGDHNSATWLLDAHVKDNDDEPRAVVALRQEDCIPYDYDAELSNDDDDDDNYIDDDADDECANDAGEYDKKDAHDGRVVVVTGGRRLYTGGVHTLRKASRATTPFSAAWLRAQHDYNRCHHAKAKEMWAEWQMQHAVLSNEACVYAVEALIVEAARRDLRRLRAMCTHPAACATRPDVNDKSSAASSTSSHRSDKSRSSNDGGGDDTATNVTAASHGPTSPSLTPPLHSAEYVAYARRQWCVLLRRVRAMMCDSVLLCARDMMSSLSMLNLFSHDAQMLVRELNVSVIEEQRRQRRLRAETLLATLAAQQRFFLLPTLRAYEEVAPHVVVTMTATSTYAHANMDASMCEYALPHSCVVATGASHADARAQASDMKSSHGATSNDADGGIEDYEGDDEDAGPSNALSECHTDDMPSPLSPASVCSEATSAHSSRAASVTNSPLRTSSDAADGDEVDGSSYSFLTPVVLHASVTLP